MKNNSIKLLLTLGTASCLFALNAPAQLINLANWNFNGQTAGGTATNISAVLSADTGEQSGSATLAFINTAATGTNFIFDAGGTIVNALDSALAGNAARLQRGERWNGAYAHFEFSTLGRRDLELSFASRFAASGVNSIQASYSTDNVSWINIGSPITLTTTYTAYVIDFGSALDNAANAYVRLTFSGAAAGTASGTNNFTLFDNITLAAVPEPSTYAALLGLLALGVVAWRRRRR